MRHGEMLAPGIERVLADAGARAADLTAIAVGVGPGPFTGLRVGLMTARTLAFVRGIPVHGVCSLDILAAAGVDAGLDEFVVATDARRKEVYLASYAGGRRVQGPEVVKPVDASDRPACRRQGSGALPGRLPERRRSRASLGGHRSATWCSTGASSCSSPTRSTCGVRTPSSPASPSGSADPLLRGQREEHRRPLGVLRVAGPLHHRPLQQRARRWRTPGRTSSQQARARSAHPGQASAATSQIPHHTQASPK